jgi:LAO/AO transport system kinase
MWDMIETGLQQQFRAHPVVQRELPVLTNRVENGTITPAAAARKLLEHLQ